MAQTDNAPARQNSSPAAVAKDFTADIENRVNQMVGRGELHLPADYSASNALRSAYLNLQEVVGRDKRPALEVCTKPSIANALLSMVVQGLNVDKKQGYFIVYGEQLAFQRSYFGSMALAKRVNPAVADFGYAVVYEGDELEYEIRRGKRIISTHKQTLGNINKASIVAAYCEAYDKGGNVIHSEIMTMEEIKQAWRQSKMNPIGNNGVISSGSTHDKFTADMALKTVIGKCCKPIINTSSDRALLNAVHTTSELADEYEAQADAEQHANGDVIDVAASPVEPPMAIVQHTGEVLDMPMHAETEPVHLLGQQAAQQQQSGPGF